MPPDPRPTGPLILGASGRVGRLWQHLAAGGLWPGAEPLWHGRTGGADRYVWDMDAPAPCDDRLHHVRGMIVLAGVTAGDAAALARNVTLAQAALDLAAREGIAPVLLTSSVAVYGHPDHADPLSETAALAATGGYGRAKQAMEAAAAVHRWPSTALRIGNVAGADSLLRNAASGPVTLHRLPDGAALRRPMVGPLTLARLCLALTAAPAPLPRAVNLASPGQTSMQALMDAAGVPYRWAPAPPDTLTSLPLDLSRLGALVPLTEATADSLVAEAVAAGWRPAA